MKAVVIALILLLAVLHQDFWWWDDRTVLFGFLPIGLAWHAAISLGAALVGWLAVLTVWPPELEEETGDTSPSPAAPGPAAASGSAEGGER